MATAKTLKAPPKRYNLRVEGEERGVYHDLRDICTQTHADKRNLPRQLKPEIFNRKPTKIIFRS